MPLSPVIVHTLFEICAYAVATRLYFRQRQSLALAILAERDRNLQIIASAAMGAALGSKFAYWLHDPLQAFMDFPDWRHLLGGKSIVGALLGGLVGVELGKKILGQAGSTGDVFVLPLAIGMGIGRLGCFFAGLADHTFGNPTSLPWGVDFGDGLPRHPTQLYEIIFIAIWTTLILRRRPFLTQTGDSFRLYLAGYLLFRLLVDLIKPVPMSYALGLSGLQWLSAAGLAYYARHLPRLIRELLWDTR